MYDRKRLEDALVVARINKRGKGDAGEVARVLQQLHEAYNCMGDGSRARALANAAEDVYQKLVASGEYTRADSVQEKWDYVICLEFR